MLPSTSSGPNSWVRRSQNHCDPPALPILIDPSTNPEYRQKRDDCFDIFDKMTEDEQVSFF
jgi:hypothetical protein